MSGLWLYSLGAVNLAVGLYSLAASVRYLASRDRRMGPQPAPLSDRPSTALLVPCCGNEAGLEGNLRALLRQDYPNLELVLIVEDEADAAVRVIRTVLAAEKRRAKLVVAGSADRRGQKVHNLLAGVAQARESEVLAFADSDGRPDDAWLSRLVAPLERKEVGVATGYRFYIPERRNFASVLRSAWNAGVLTLLGDHNHNFAWGGSMAIRREVFEESGIERVWQSALSDDYTLTHAVRRAGYRVKFVPTCLVASGGKVRLAEVAVWSERQIAVTRVYWPNLWRIAAGSQALLMVFLAAGATAAVAGDVLAGSVLGAVLALGVLSGVVRARAIETLGLPWCGDLRRYRWTYAIMFPVVGLLSAYGFLRSFLSRRIEWRGKTYEMRSPTETILIGPGGRASPPESSLG